MDWRRRAECVEQEDLVMFINSCFACTRQNEFYSDACGQAFSIEFLHAYVMGNYRRLYARTLAAGINHFNQAQILVNLLAAGAPADAADRAEEGALIAATLAALPPQRAFKAIHLLRERRVNNRRTRATIQRYVRECRDPVFTAVKYRNKLRGAAAHAHLRLDEEMGLFLFQFRSQRTFRTELFERFRQAHYAQSAVYDLPYTIAEGLAARHRIPRDEFLRHIAGKMTAGEKLRLQQTAARSEKVQLKIDLGRSSPTRLALYLLSLPREEREARQEELNDALERAADRAIRHIPIRLGKVAAVLDASYSTSGSSEKRRRPLAVALAASYLLRAMAQEYRAFWTPPAECDLLVEARGQTALAAPLLDSLEWGPDLVILVSDGYENDPPCGAAEVARVYRERLDPLHRTEILHMNPVFDAQHYAPRAIGPAIPTVGLRDAEDIPTMLGFARFASGSSSRAELEEYLSARVQVFLGA